MSATVTRSAMGLCRRVLEFVERTLSPHGFSYLRQSGLYVRPRSAIVHDWIMLPLDVAYDGRGVFVTANLSIHCPTVDEQLDSHPAALRNDPAGEDRVSRGNLSSFTRNIGHLLPDEHWRQWEIVDDEHAEKSLRGFATTLVELGLPWCERFETLADVRDGFVVFGRRDHFTSTLPALDRLLAEQGDSEPLRRTAHAGRPALCGPHSPAFSATAATEPLWLCDD